MASDTQEVTLTTPDGTRTFNLKLELTNEGMMEVTNLDDAKRRSGVQVGLPSSTPPDRSDEPTMVAGTFNGVELPTMVITGGEVQSGDAPAVDD